MSHNRRTVSKLACSTTFHFVQSVTNRYLFVSVVKDRDLLPVICQIPKKQTLRKIADRSKIFLSSMCHWTCLMKVAGKSNACTSRYIFLVVCITKFVIDYCNNFKRILSWLVTYLPLFFVMLFVNKFLLKEFLDYICYKTHFTLLSQKILCRQIPLHLWRFIFFKLGSELQTSLQNSAKLLYTWVKRIFFMQCFKITAVLPPK